MCGLIEELAIVGLHIVGETFCHGWEIFSCYRLKAVFAVQASSSIFIIRDRLPKRDAFYSG